MTSAPPPDRPRISDAPPTSVDAALARAVADGVAMNEALDALTAGLRETQKALKAVRLGVFGSVVLHPSQYQLTWTADHTFVVGPQDSAPTWLLLNAPLYVRLEAANALPELVKQLCEKAEARLAEVRAATASTQKARTLIVESARPRGVARTPSGR